MVENLALATDGSDYWRDTLASQGIGRVYTWTAAMRLSAAGSDTTWWGGSLPRQGVCPTGWHVASDSEWLSLGMAAQSDSFRSKASDDTYYGGTCYWSSSEYSKDGAWGLSVFSLARTSDGGPLAMTRNFYRKNYMRLYVRCVEDR